MQRLQRSRCFLCILRKDSGIEAEEITETVQKAGRLSEPEEG